ncbi:Hypothetical protein PACV_198 [Pacmanvirus A23]|uniref:Hypothetical protein n=1 Tax=Pacmanvirus A23 TaxID=1932881 RepID=UPI000A0949F0|nr:Hypothetical protein B9W72_gp196 [Pacmanvirus A23]SIP85913.1 Hypothetical protein PACV_198 [Pacmanvirus A23]
MIKVAIGVIVVIVVLLFLLPISSEGFRMPDVIKKAKLQAQQKLGMRASTKTEQFSVAQMNKAVADVRDHAATFSNTLQRRMGMDGAGEKFTDKSVAAGTVWAGYM